MGKGVNSKIEKRSNNTSLNNNNNNDRTNVKEINNTNNASLNNNITNNTGGNVDVISILKITNSRIKSTQ